MTIRRFERTFVQALAAAVLAVGALGVASTVSPDRAAMAQQARDAGAEQFVQVQAQRAVGVLSDTSKGPADRIRTFRALVDQIADVPRITSFVLGKYARTVTPAQQQRFAVVFREYAQNVYEKRLGDFHGNTVRVTGSVAKRPGDVVVNTMISGGGASQPLPVSWRVLGGGSSWKVVDVQVSGIWLAITQQQDFVSTIDNNGGNVDVLIGQLERQTQQQQAARPK
jgi:phospholipid transport system substrate-binding protein